MGSITNQLKTLLLDKMAFLYGWGSTFVLVLLVIAYFSPLGEVRIGGTNAKPLLSLSDWFNVALCTTIAVGILFWASAEPLFHMTKPPASLGIEPNSYASGVFALSTLFMHWTFVPYAIYTLPALLFALAFFNDKKPFSIVSCLHPFSSKSLNSVCDVIALFCLVVGMASSLGTGILSLSGGVEFLTGFKSGPGSWVLMSVLIVSCFVISATTGIEKGIRILSSFNTKMFFFLILFFLILGPTQFIFGLTFDGIREFFSTFWGRATFTSFATNDSWPKDWPVFYLANWLAWAPVTATFLGRIGYGYTVRAFILMNLGVLSTFGAIWMSIFGGVAIHMHIVQHLPLNEILTQRGAEGVMYYVLSQFPLALLVIPLFLVTLFISYVTSADSNTIAMAALSTKNVSLENPEPPTQIKIVWGLLIGLLSIAMLFTQGLQGIKTMSILGGFPALVFEILCAAAFSFRIWVSIRDRLSKESVRCKPFKTS